MKRRACGAINAHNCHAVAGFVPHAQLSEPWPDLSPLAPFYSSVVAFNDSGSGGRLNSRPLLPRYIEPVRQHWIGAIRVQIAPRASCVRTLRFIAAPGTEVDPATLLVTPTPTASPTKTTSQSEPPNIEDADPPITTSTPVAVRSLRPAPTRE